MYFFLRFYSDNSSFVHGGLDNGNIGVAGGGGGGSPPTGGGKTGSSKPVYGQQEIHQRIKQLDFKDCHAKIRQVRRRSFLTKKVFYSNADVI